MTFTTSKNLILGGARSGKSSYAEALCLEYTKTQNQPLIYLATATAGDDEMARRIAQHQSDRDAQWHVIEEPIELSKALDSVKQPSIILVDCLTLWLSNCLHSSPECWQHEKPSFLEVLNNSSNTVVLVSNEVGHGITPMGELSRTYIDEIGWLHQELARQCENVTMVIAGLPQKLK